MTQQSNAETIFFDTASEAESGKDDVSTDIEKPLLNGKGEESDESGSSFEELHH